MTQSTALVTIAERRAAAAEKYVSQVRDAPMGDLLRIKSGRFMIGDDDIGNELCLVILNSIYVNTFFADGYVEGVKAAPTCYAYGQPGDVMAPHPSMAEHPETFVPQNDECATCPMNEFGSARIGDGKACANKVKLAVFPAGQYTPRPKPSRDVDLDLIDGKTPEGQAHFRDADALSVVLPVTSVKNFDAYVRKLALLGQLPIGVATRDYIEPHAKYQFTVEFELIDALADEVYDIVEKRFVAMGSEMATAFTPPKVVDKPRGQQLVKNLVRR